MTLMSTLYLTLLSLFSSASSSSVLANPKPLVDLLKNEQCSINLLALNSYQVVDITERLPKPVGVITSITSRTLVPKHRCNVFVANSETSRSEREISFLRKYALKILFISSEKDEEAFAGFQSFKNSITILQSLANGNTLLRLSCSTADGGQVVNLWKEDAGWIRSADSNGCRSVLKDQHVNVSAAGLPPFIITKGIVSGIDPDVIEIMSRKLRFTYDIQVELFWGAEIGKSGVWSGVIGKVMNESAQFGIGNIIIQENRHDVVDFLHLIHPMNMKLLSGEPKLHMPIFNLLRPFSSDIWLAIAVALVVVTCAVTALTLCSPMKKPGSVNLMNTTLSAYSLLLNQRFDVMSGRLSLRIGYGTWHVCAFFILASYLCNLRSNLMKVQYERPVDSEDDIVNLNRKLFLPRGTPFISLFATSPIKVQQEIYKTTDANGQYFTSPNGKIPAWLEAELIDHGNVMLFDKSQLMPFYKDLGQRYGHIPLRLGKKVVFPFLAGFVVPKNTLWTSEANDVIAHLYEAGVIEKLENKYIQARFAVEEEPDTSPVAFRADQMFGALIILGGGILLSSVVFAFEKIVM